VASADEGKTEDEYTGQWCFADERGYLMLWAQPDSVFFRMPGQDLPVTEKQVDNMMRVLTEWKERRRG